MKYPEVETEKPVRCSKKRCPALCFRVPLGAPFVVECTGKQGCNQLVRGHSVPEVESLWSRRPA